MPEFLWSHFQDTLDQNLTGENMAKDIKTKEEFVRLRAEGKSFNQISGELKVSKPTLLSWAAEFRREIDSLKLIRFEHLIEQFQAMKEDRLRVLAETRQRLVQELRNRDFKDVATDRLFKLLLSIEKRINEETASIAHLEPTGFDKGEELYSTRIDIS